MANREYSKEKLLLLYDIFCNELAANSVNSNISMEYLKKRISEFMLGIVGADADDKFLETDRKTIYKFIDAINNYISMTGNFVEDDFFVDADDENAKFGNWIKVYHKKSYVRGQLKNEITEEEYEAISDAISSSSIVSEEAFAHFKAMCPNSISKYKSNTVYFRQNTVDVVFTENVSRIKLAISEKKAISFIYGYRIGASDSNKNNKLFAVSEKLVTPIKLDYSDGRYYLYALDNRDSQFRSYRVDRIENVSVRDDMEYIEVDNIETKLADKIEGAVNQFATGKDKVFVLKIESNNPKVAAQAFQSFADSVTVKRMINDERKWEQGLIECLCNVQLSPTFYMRLFNLVTFDIDFDKADNIILNVTIDPNKQDGREVVEGFERYCDKLNGFLQKGSKKISQ